MISSLKRQIKLSPKIIKYLGFSKKGSETLRIQDGEVLIKQAIDIVSLAGILHDKIDIDDSLKNMGTKETKQLERESYKYIIIKKHE